MILPLLRPCFDLVFRREWGMRFLILLTAVFTLPQLSAAEKPNVIIVYTDDQGSVDANCYGATDLATPNIDRLAETGVRFTQMLAPSAICSASRAGLLTGQMPARAGVPANVSSAKGNSGMPTEKVTIAEALKKNWICDRPYWKVASRLHSRDDAECARLRLFLRAYGRVHR